MTTDLVPAGQIRNLPAVQREQAVTTYLATARDRLSDALTATGPESVAAIKAEVSTVAEMAKQLGLSKECRDDATEMVRRKQTGNAKGHCVAAAAVDINNRGRGGKKLPSWWREDA